MKVQDFICLLADIDCIFVQDYFKTVVEEHLDASKSFQFQTVSELANVQVLVRQQKFN